MSRDQEEVKGQAISKPLLKNIADRQACGVQGGCSRRENQEEVGSDPTGPPSQGLGFDGEELHWRLEPELTSAPILRSHMSPPAAPSIMFPCFSECCVSGASRTLARTVSHTALGKMPWSSCSLSAVIPEEAALSLTLVSDGTPLQALYTLP